MVQTINTTAEVLVAHTCLLGEGPVWNRAEQCILWLDVLRGQIHSYYPETKTHKTFNVNRMVGAVVIRRAGGLLAALQDGFALINTNYNTVIPIADPEAQLPGNRFNDGKCDPAGRFWAGTMSLTEAPNAGSLYVLEPNLSVSKKIEGTTISNGMAWSPDNSTFYYIDTPTMQVVAYDYNTATGEISNKRVAIQVADEEGYPDGMTIDTEGMLWIAHWDGWQVARWNPNTGEKLLSIPLPVARVSCCTFGGETYEDLYITTAKKELSEKELKEQPLAGALFIVRNCGFKGMAPFEFKG